ncbi:hypothetical protein HDK90DRAFT_112373 [Phyllosticta capitalensis]|uniref:K Homology domain-containing protein n=1 Tax=Phyllosticta capitalensis TaxID=121624 RepID=A0ABR1YA59_9PEZI
MHKISNFTGQARHGWEKMTPSMGFSMSRSHNDLPNPPVKRPSNAAAAVTPTITPGTFVNLSFNVPFASNLSGPDADDVVYASPGAFARWTRQDDNQVQDAASPPPPAHTLPVHATNVDNLRSLCRHLSATSSGTLEATVVCSEPKPLPGLQRATTLVTNVCLSGESELVRSIRCKILNETPISLRCATVDIDYSLVFENEGVKSQVLNHLDEIAKVTKADIFLLQPKPVDIESASINGTLHDAEQRLRCAIYGDMESAEHAKTRVLIMIDQILHRHVDTMKLELSMHTLICGRVRKNIKLIESATNTAIYFPPPFPRLYGYTPPGAIRRPEDEIIITGKNPDDILAAKRKLHDLVLSTRAFVKEVVVTPTKIDSILLERLDKVRKIIENNGSYILLPPLGFQRGPIRVQGTDVLNVERTVRELMALAGQFYSASWCITHADQNQRPPTPDDVRAMLSDICINSGAEISFERLNFHISGSDDAVKAAMMVINNIPFVRKSQYQISVKIELANEHKEFVSGKKNGKINKIMSQSNVQIVFDGFNEYNFYIVVRGGRYDDVKGGLDLVEQEMPAAISFHVPDQYHKRIIGIGGQHIQRIMKKYSVFVKFSNAMDRGGLGKEEDDIKVDNVICRTPARNAQNLDLVKQEIMDMVEKVDAEFVSEHVVINRLYHRELIARMSEIEDLEKRWNCKIVFPSTEEASDVVTVSGPEYQVPQAVDEFLAMVPETHEMSFFAAPDLKDYLKSEDFKKDVLAKMKNQYNIEVHVNDSQPGPADQPDRSVETVVMSYTRNYAGGLKDALDEFVARLAGHGLEVTQIIKGAIPRPKSDSFEDSLPYFASKVLQPAEPRVDSTDSPTRSVFGDDSSERVGFLDRLRKPGSMSSFTSFIDRRKNGSNSPGSLFTHGSRNASKASLVSLESTSSYRNPWNDSGINLPDDDQHANGWTAQPAAAFHHSNSSKLSFHSTTASAAPGDMTPRYDPRASVDSGRPSTSHSASGYPAPIGPPR